jgi:hypothetical protein
VISSLPADAKGGIAIFTSDGRRTVHFQFNGNSSGEVALELPQLAPGLHLMRLTTGYENITRTLLCLGKSEIHFTNGSAQGTGIILAKRSAAPAVDTLIAVKTGYADAKVPVDSYEKEGIEIVMQEDGPSGPMPLVYEVENTGEDCEVTTTFPSFNDLPTIENFPDPFLMEDGSRISTKAQWSCRRAEISNQIQYWELGTKPGPGECQVDAIY